MASIKDVKAIERPNVIVRAEGTYIRPDLKSPHSIETQNTILNDLVESLFETIGKLETSDIMIRLCKDKQIGAYWIFAKTPAQNEWAVIYDLWYLDKQVARFWMLVDDIRCGKRLVIYDDN